MVVIGILTDWVLAPKGTTHSLYLVPQLNYFLTGFLLADVFATELAMGKAIRRSLLWDLPGTVAWILIFVATCCFKVDSLVFPVLIFIAYLAALRGILWNAFTTNPVIFTIGGMCYTIYLWHNLVIEILMRKLHVANHMFSLLGPRWFLDALSRSSEPLRSGGEWRLIRIVREAVYVQDLAERLRQLGAEPPSAAG